MLFLLLERSPAVSSFLAVAAGCGGARQVALGAQDCGHPAQFSLETSRALACAAVVPFRQALAGRGSGKQRAVAIRWPCSAVMFGSLGETDVGDRSDQRGS